jgi:TPR repeat protein
MGRLAVAYRFGYLGLEKDEQQYRYWMDKAMAIDKEGSKNWRR